MARPLRIAMIGQKGIPARYGGIETHVEQIATRLADRGHDVNVFCRRRFAPAPEEATPENGFTRGQRGLVYRGVHLRFRPSVNTKHLDAATHTAWCALETALRPDLDIVHFHGIGPSAFLPMARLGGRTVISTIHALDWRQVKWGGWAKRRLLQGEATAVRQSHGVIAVSRLLVDYIADKYGVQARYIPNGATPGRVDSTAAVEGFGLRTGDYILTVGRIIPDRGLHYLIDAFQRVDSGLKLVIVGSEVPRTGYSDRLRAMAGDRVLFTGDLYGRALNELYAHCRFYVLPSEVEGLPITVCEAMGFGRPVLLSDIPENREVGEDVAVLFRSADTNDLADKLRAMLDADFDLASRGSAGRERVRAHYAWDDLAVAVEAFYYDVLASRGRNE